VTAAIREALEVIAGPRAFGRREAYALDDRVHSLARGADALAAYGASDGVWLDLARRRGEDHADDAAEVYRRLVERAIDGKDRRAYREAAVLVTELRDLLRAHGRLADYDSTLDAVRQTHARKRALLDELSRAEARWRTRPVVLPCDAHDSERWCP